MSESNLFNSLTANGTNKFRKSSALQGKGLKQTV